ncbi:MAG: 2-C-methyl-D-erythritol 4-phosphate cytidylyltransferase [Lachnospiraceae bacterium]|nr:2-C-methyl-D-erythritol 4-phosphate cytidylyltransferase [Lachnospiraceae bacterium]
MKVALLTAGGMGARMNLDIPKQFIYVDDKPLIIYTLEAFEKHPMIDEIVVVCLKNYIELMKTYVNEYGITKVKWIVEGGNTGQESINNGLNKINEIYDEETIVLIHDGNRPNVSQEIITDAITTYYECGSAVAAIPCVEAIFKSVNGRESAESIPRESLFRTQTPHVFGLKKLLWAHEQAKIKKINNTVATCTLMNELGEKIYFSKGSDKNLKITTQDDLDIFIAMKNCKKNNH